MNPFFFVSLFFYIGGFVLIFVGLSASVILMGVSGVSKRGYLLAWLGVGFVLVLSFFSVRFAASL